MSQKPSQTPKPQPTTSPQRRQYDSGNIPTQPSKTPMPPTKPPKK